MSANDVQPRPAPLDAASGDGRPPVGRDVLFLGTHGQFNVGDELLLETFLGQLGSQHRFMVNSYDPARTAAALDGRYDVDVFDTASGRLALLGRIRRCDAVVFGGGSILKELYASVGRWRHATLVMVLALVLVAKMFRRPVMMAGIGVGPVDSWFGRRLVGIILRLVDLVSVRDDQSLALCERVGAPAGRVVRTPDAVFANPPEAFGAPTGDARPERRPGMPRVALNLNRDIANGDRWDDFLAELAEALDLVASVTPIEVHALPMQSEFKTDDDLTVLRSFLDGRDSWHPVVHEVSDHHDVGRIIADCDAVVSERLHALVIAAILGRSAVGLIYDVKVEELTAQLGIRSHSVDINLPVDALELAGMILTAIEEAEPAGHRLAERARDLHTEVGHHFDTVRAWLDDPSTGWT